MTEALTWMSRGTENEELGRQQSPPAKKKTERSSFVSLSAFGPQVRPRPTLNGRPARNRLRPSRKPIPRLYKLLLLLLSLLLLLLLLLLVLLLLLLWLGRERNVPAKRFFVLHFCDFQIKKTSSGLGSAHPEVTRILERRALARNRFPKLDE